MNLTPIELEIFALRSVIAEKNFAEKKIASLKKELDVLENGSEIMQISWARETIPSSKTYFMNQIILTRGKVASINKYRQHLIYDLEITPPSKDNSSGTLGWKAKQAKDRLIEIGIF